MLEAYVKKVLTYTDLYICIGPTYISAFILDS